MKNILSFSLINQYIKCPKMALLSLNKSVIRRKEMSESGLEFGKAVHSLIKSKWFDVEYIKNDAEYWFMAERLADKALTVIGDENCEAEAEKRLTVEADDYVLVGDLDFVVYKDDEVVIYDWKTNRKKFGANVEQYRWQAYIYMYLMDKNLDDERKIVFEFHNLRFDGDCLTFELDDEIKNKVEQLSLEVARFLDEGNVQLNDDDGYKDCCNTCKFSDFCRVL